jgi:hypothetical protein
MTQRNPSAQLHPLVGQTDIVERLSADDWWRGEYGSKEMLCLEAVDEINRLRTALRAVRACTDPAWAAQIVKEALREEQ